MERFPQTHAIFEMRTIFVSAETWYNHRLYSKRTVLGARLDASTSHTRRTRLADPKITLHFPHLFVFIYMYIYIYIYIYVYLCICTYHMHNIYVTYIVAMRPNFSRLQQFRQLLCVATMGSLAQLEFEMDT